MPTHEDHPWERDARKRASHRGGARPSRTGRRPAAAVAGAAIAVAALVVGLPAGTLDVGSGGPVAPAPAAGTGTTPRVGGSVSELRMRPAGTASIEIWGATDAVDGASVQLRVRIRDAGRSRRLAVAPAAGGHFYAKARIPRALRGRRLTVTARVTG